MSNLNDDIEKYLRGELPREEMHRLEKKALDDPFLADALEGAQTIGPQDFRRDVDTINSRLAGGSKNYLGPLRIAASILLVATVAYFSITNWAPGEDQLAFNKEPKPENSAVETTTSPNTAGPGDSSTVDKNRIALNSDKVAVEEETKAAKSASKPSTRPAESSGAGAQPSISDDRDELAEVIIEDSFVAENKPAEISKEKVEAYDLKDETRDLSEDLVTTSDRELRKADAPVSSQLQTESRARKQASVSVPTLPQPILEGRSYQEYLSSHVKYPESAIENKAAGEVIVSFIVKANGQLSDFRTEQSIGFDCDKELISVIKNGPQWRPASNDDQPVNQRATVRFTFVLPK